MTPTEVDALDADTYAAFVVFMERDARDTDRAIKAAKAGKR